MNKEEILEKARKENKNGDEREEKIKLRSYAISASIGALLCITLAFVENVIFDRNVAHIWIIYNGMLFSKTLLDAIKLKKKSTIISSVFWGVLLVCWIVLYVLNIIG